MSSSTKRSACPGGIDATMSQYQPGELAVEHQLKAQFHVDLHYLHPHVEVEGGFLAIDSNGLPHVITAECQNPVPLGTPKIITKKTNTDTLGTNVVLATTGVGVTATASAALGAEHTKENQLPPNTPYASRISSTRIIGTTFEIIPFAEVAGAQPNSVSVDLHLAPSQTPGIGEAAIRKESNRFPLLASSRSNRGCLGRTTLDSNRIYGELRGMGTHVFVVPKLSPIYLAVRSGADAKTSYAIVTGLDYPTVITQDGTGYTGVLGLKSRLMPRNVQPWYKTLLRRLTPRRMRSVPPRRLETGAFELWGRAGWMALDVERWIEIAPVGLDSDGAFMLEELQRNPKFSLRRRPSAF
ncbi:hypothetical protein B0H10DRAFT_2229328 [Mycena sp. CBHHK59/15]|nr:hypothetical protein B0H10DRAFT_2229328 [Mycena sp. CBHHK59/15]